MPDTSLLKRILRYRRAEPPAPLSIERGTRAPYRARYLDFDNNPRTGWSRETWLDAGGWILREAIQALPDPDGPMIWPRQSHKLYPQAGDPAQRIASAAMEGLARTLLIAAPVLSENDIEFRGMSLRSWYRERLVSAVNPESRFYAGPDSSRSASAAVQQQVEGGALAVALWMGNDWLWEPLADDDKQCILEFLCNLGHRQTLGHNWRFFSVLMLSFVDRSGGDVDEAVLLTHLRNIIAWQSGDGYYRDGERFDYYAAWSFQLYAALWIHYYGGERYPQVAAALQAPMQDFLDRYPGLFARDGRQIAWGRSGIYRCASAAPLAAFGLLGNLNADWGYIRRLCSGALKSVLENPLVWHSGVPSPGLYDTFEPMLQAYSCSGSAYWLGKVFVACKLSADNDFWAECESEGPWRKRGLQQSWWPGAGLLTIARPDGSSELVPGKVRMRNSDHLSSSAIYLRLAYHSEFPWAMSPHESSPMGVTINCGGREWRDPVERRLIGLHNDWLLSQMGFDSAHSVLDIAMRPIADGMVLVLRPRLSDEFRLRVGSYALPRGAGRFEHITTAPGAELLRNTSDNRYVALRCLDNASGIFRQFLEEGCHPEPGDSEYLVAQFESERYRNSEYLVVEMRYGYAGTSRPEPVVVEIERSALGIAGPLALKTARGDVWELSFSGTEGIFTS